nr:retrovirus-related Pol polyprotein from transposon TNT 1-94 [Tanacetum cinerariifolium]
MEGVTTFMPTTSVKDKAQRRLEVKARSTLMMGILNEHQLKFNSIKDAKQLMEAIKKRFRRNASIKKTQRNLLKQQYENFTASNSEIDQTFDRLQKLVSQLELLGEKLSHEDVNQKLLRSLSPEWNTHAMIWSNKTDLDTMSMDDLYNNLKMAMLTMRAKRFLKKTGRKLTVNGNDTIGFDKFNVEFFNYHKKGHFAWECRAPRSQDTKHKESTRRTVHVETPASIALVSCDGLGGYDWSDQAEEGPNYALMASTSIILDLKIIDNRKKGLGYERYNNTVPPLYTGNFMPPKPDLSYIGLDEFANKPVVENCDAKTSETKPNDGSACWVWKPKTKVIDHFFKHNSASITLKKFDYVDAQGRSKSMMAWVSKRYYKDIDEGYEAFGGNPMGGKITSKGTKDETSGILKSFIIRKGILVDQKNTIFKFYEAILVSSYHSQYLRSLSDSGKKVDEDPSKGSECKDQEQDDNANNTNNVNATSINRVIVVCENISNELPFDPNMPILEDISTFNILSDHEDGAKEADVNNMGTKCVFRNKKDERGIVIINKASLVAQGHTQEEGIYNDELFASVARIEAIRLFLAYASFKDFVVYQIDVKSAFLNGKIKEEVYVCQPSGFEDPGFPAKVFKVEKALYCHTPPRRKREVDFLITTEMQGTKFPP